MRSGTGNGTDERPAADLLADFSVDPDQVDQDLAVAKKAVVVHQGEQWPAGQFCRNCHARWPCRLYRWGHLVLWLAGWREDQIAGLVQRAEAGEAPWL